MLLSKPSQESTSSPELADLEEWIRNDFQCHMNLNIAPWVSTANLLHSHEPLNDILSAKPHVKLFCTREQIIEQCNRKFLQILKHKFLQHSLSESKPFLPNTLLNQVVLEAEQQSIARCQQLCTRKRLAQQVITKLENNLSHFSQKARAKIETQNWKNCKVYLEYNKKNVIQQFCDELKEYLESLFDTPPIEKIGHFVFYDCEQMATSIRPIIEQAVQKWNKIKEKADPNMARHRDDYLDDLETSLHQFMNEILMANTEPSEGRLREIIENEFKRSMENIKSILTTATNLEEITHEDIDNHVTSFRQRVLVNMDNMTMRKGSIGPNSVQVEDLLKDKEKELVNFGSNLIQREFEKIQDSLNLSSNDNQVNNSDGESSEMHEIGTESAEEIKMEPIEASSSETKANTSDFETVLVSDDSDDDVYEHHSSDLDSTDISLSPPEPKRSKGGRILRRQKQIIKK